MSKPDKARQKKNEKNVSVFLFVLVCACLILCGFKYVSACLCNV